MGRSGGLQTGGKGLATAPHNAWHSGNDLHPVPIVTTPSPSNGEGGPRTTVSRQGGEGPCPPPPLRWEPKGSGAQNREWRGLRPPSHRVGRAFTSVQGGEVTLSFLPCALVPWLGFWWRVDWRRSSRRDALMSDRDPGTFPTECIGGGCSPRRPTRRRLKLGRIPCIAPL